MTSDPALDDPESSAVVYPAPEPAAAGIGHRIAVVLSEVLAPWIFAGVMPPLVGALTGHPWWRGGLLGAGAAVLSAGIPYVLILRGVRKGRLTDRHVGRRQDRPLLLGVIAVLVVAALVLVVAAGAPRALVALVVVMIACVVVGLVVSVWWKLSMHLLVATASVTGLALLVSPWMMLLAVPVVALACARVHLRAHTPAQVTVGAVAGAVVSAAVILGLTG